MGHYVIKPTKSGGAHDPRPQLWWHPWKIEYLYPLRMCCKGLLPSFLLHTWSRASDLLNPFPFVVMLISEPRLIMFFFGRSWLWSWFKDGPKDFILEPSWNYVLPSSSVLDYEARHRPYLDSSIKNYIIYFFWHCIEICHLWLRIVKVHLVDRSRSRLLLHLKHKSKIVIVKRRFRKINDVEGNYNRGHCIISSVDPNLVPDDLGHWK